MSAPIPLPAAPDVIVGVGARTASGLTALQVTMSARARKLDPRPSHIVDRNGEAIATARLMSLGDNVTGMDRLVALGAPALIQAAHPWLSAARERRAEPVALPVIAALPALSRPGVDPRIERRLLPELSARSRVPLDMARSRVIFGCRGGGVAAFAHALAMLRRGDCDAVAVGGLDSYFDPDALEHLDRELRLHSMTAENGFIPGEGAGFVVLAARSRAAALHRHGQVIAAACEDEPRPYGSEQPSLALGVTLAMKHAAEPFGPARRIPWVLTDVANERHRVDEWSYASARNYRGFAPEMIHEQPLLHTGDLGAASAAVLLVMAAVRWQTGCAAGDCAMIVTHSDGPERGAMLVSQEAAP
ncbi:beta-ketoacyl synthase N-terminal-like domain-containing protein [Sorangium sp. So ce388]|uniref:beta-ketoacyl synthase N-terminal-like domain-containing protein n=1 Tax=Sorangium sp. So ce388 TaxID=3133309 RepID=UPI003F5B494A